MLVKKISFISFVLFISCSSNKDSNKRLPISNFNGLKIGFASCLNQERKMPIFNTIKAESLDLFLMMGDNVYGNSTSENLNELREAYDKQKQNSTKRKQQTKHKQEKRKRNTRVETKKLLYMVTGGQSLTYI